MKWISVKEDLPKGIWHELHKHLSEDVLMCNGMDYYIGRYNRKEMEWETDEPADRNTVYEVTHWMSLPHKP